MQKSNAVKSIDLDIDWSAQTILPIEFRGREMQVEARAYQGADPTCQALVLVHREMPLSPIDVNNYKTLSDAGVILASANPGFYLNPQTVTEVVDFVAAKLLDLVGVKHVIGGRWDPENPSPPLRYGDRGVEVVNGGLIR